MKYKKFMSLICIMMIFVLTFSTTVFAADSTDNIQFSNTADISNYNQSRAATLLTSGHFSKQGSSQTFYCAGGIGKAFYLSLYGDSNSYVNFTVFHENTAIWSGSFKADGKMHTNMFLKLNGGNYHIDLNTASDNTITYAMSWNA